MGCRPHEHFYLLMWIHVQMLHGSLPQILRKQNFRFCKPRSILIYYLTYTNQGKNFNVHRLQRIQMSKKRSPNKPHQQQKPSYGSNSHNNNEHFIWNILWKDQQNWKIFKTEQEKMQEEITKIRNEKKEHDYQINNN